MSLKVKIGADASSFMREMDKVDRRGASMGDKMMKAGKKAGVGLAAIGVAAAAAAYGIARLIQSASSEASGIESLTMQFETLLGGAEQAKDRMRELVDFAATTPFEIKELAQTSKLLQTLGGSMLSTGEGLRMVGDAAAIAGQPLSEVGLHIGRIFNAITSGTSAGESINRMQELGLMSGTVKKRFEELAAAQKKGDAQSMSSADALKLLKGVFANTEGAMARLASTTEGKLSNLKDNIAQLKVSFGTGFNDGLRVALDAVNENLPKLQDKIKAVGDAIGITISSAIEGDTARLEKAFETLGIMAGGAFAVGLKFGLRTAGATLLTASEDMAKKAASFAPGAAGLISMIPDSGLGGKWQSGANKMFKNDAGELGKEIVSAAKALQASPDASAEIIGRGGAKFGHAPEGVSTSFRDSTGRMLVLLQEVARNTAKPTFATQ